MRLFRNLFCHLTTLLFLLLCRYAINTQDTSGGVPGVLYGRYQGDTYAGGNPWVLSTGALAGLLYRGASYILKHGAPSSQALGVWKTAFNSPSDLPTSSAALAQVFAAQGDGVLQRLRNHVQADGFHLDEQIDRNTGQQMSASDLTWSVSKCDNDMVVVVVVVVKVIQIWTLHLRCAIEMLYCM